jgi:hypothetical protein
MSELRKALDTNVALIGLTQSVLTNDSHSRTNRETPLVPWLFGAAVLAKIAQYAYVYLILPSK